MRYVYEIRPTSSLITRGEAEEYSYKQILIALELVREQSYNTYDQGLCAHKHKGVGYNIASYENIPL
jgi:hypothetical protein